MAVDRPRARRQIAIAVMAGLALPDGGRVLVNGSDLSGMNDKALTLFRRRRTR